MQVFATALSNTDHSSSLYQVSATALLGMAVMAALNLGSDRVGKWVLTRWILDWLGLDLGGRKQDVQVK